MNLEAGFKISWDAPALPGASLAGVPLGTSSDILMDKFKEYIAGSDDAYKFYGSPELRLVAQGLDAFGNGSYSFFIRRCSGQ